MPPDTEQPPVPAAPRRQVGHRGRGAGPVCRRRTCALLRGAAMPATRPRVRLDNQS